MTLDPIALQVMTGALRAACDEMGAVLIRSAHSPNIKERHDCSTALFDAHGEMVMQAEHIPVHLGAMPAAVRAVLGEDHAPGVSWILNDPYRGGTHLPDITVITPVFVGSELLGFAASRAHHADVGGRVPGSMPADSRTLAEEGVIIAPRVLDAPAIEELVAQMRGPGERRADLRAQLAANRIGAQRLEALARRAGSAALREAMAAVLDYAERRTRACLREMPDGVREARDVLEAVDGDLELVLRATVEDDRIVLDFTGSAGMDTGNLNCPAAVTFSACVFAVRVLTDPDIPPSAGAHRPVEVVIPAGTLLNARAPAAVAGGNVETSSRVADLVLGAFGCALGQGTMNNLTLGNDQLHVLRDRGRRPGSVRGRRRAQRGARRDVQHPQHADRGARARAARAHDRVLRQTRQRGRRGVSRWRRRRAGVRGVAGHDLLADHRAPPPRTARRRGRCRRRCGVNVVAGEQVPAKASGTLRAGERLRLETPGGGGFGAADGRTTADETG